MRRGRPLPGIVLGFGLGGFLDGIVLHQLLQWHHLVSARETASTVSGLETNTFWDGVFHLSVWAVTVVGIALVLRSRPVDGRALAAPALAGWGLFSVLDQLVFHLALGAHHIRETESYQVYDWSFFAFGLALIAAGTLLARARRAY